MSEQPFLPIVLFVLFGAVVIAIAVVAWRLEKKRRAALAATAARLGLSFSPDPDHAFARQYQELRGLNVGENRYAFDILAGVHAGQRITAFDFHYETSSADSKGRRSTSHHHCHVVLLHLDREFPALFVAPEGIFSKIAQAVGHDDIDFESHEFSRRFCVRSADRKYAYDFCNSSMIEFLLAHPALRLETRGSVLAALFDGKMSPPLVESELGLVCAARARMPDYLFAVR